GLPTFWYGPGPGQAPRVTLTARAEDRWRASASATELVLIALAGAGGLAYRPRGRRGGVGPATGTGAGVRLAAPRRVVPMSAGVRGLRVVGGVGARGGLGCVWVQDGVRGRGPDESPTASGLSPA